MRWRADWNSLKTPAKGINPRTGSRGATSALSNGIAEAMYNTAFGLGIAVTCMIAHVILHTRAKNIQHDLEGTMERVFNLLTITNRPAAY